MFNFMAKVLYNDGDVEVLCLGKERWELIDDGHRPKKVCFIMLRFIHLIVQYIFRFP